MPRSIQQVDAFMRDPANRNRHQGDGWHNLCEQFVNNAGDFNQAFGTALAAGNASGWLDPNLATITDGSIGYWSGVWINGEECGHVAFWLGGRWLMASDACTEKVGNGTGTITATDYARSRPAASWRGHSKRHGTETLTRSAFAGLDIKVLPTIKEEEDVIYPWVFITEDARIGGVWWKYDGRAKYMCAPGDPQMLVDLGLARSVDVKVLGPRINSIPSA